MIALRNILFVAALAGFAAGVVMTVMQLYTTVPLILQAETFELAEAAAPVGSMAGHDHADHVAAMAPAAHEHEHDADAWAPADGFERTVFTALAGCVTAVGFGLLLVAASEFAGGISTLRQGLVWGLAGFATFTLAPNLGLPPELPAMPAADLAARQLWWITCVGMTAAGLALIVFGRAIWLPLLGAVLLVLPHLMGAPQPASFDLPIPEGLHHQFVVAATVTNLVFWLVLGAVTSLVRPQFAEGLAAPKVGFA